MIDQTNETLKLGTADNVKTTIYLDPAMFDVIVGAVRKNRLVMELED